MPSPSLLSGIPPARPSPGRLASRAALALSVWMAAAPATARAEEEDPGSAGYEIRSDSDTGIATGEDRREPVRRRGGKVRGDFDPKVFEARGRELQGEYYEIPPLATAPTWAGLPAGLPAEDSAAPEDPAPKNWILWGGVAGAAALVAGLAGWLLIQQPGNAEPVSVYLDDKP